MSPRVKDAVAAGEPEVIDLMVRLKQELAKPPAVGVHENVDAEIYHRWDTASNSRLTLLKRSPAHLRAAMIQPPDETAALRIGKALHSAVLEPDLFPTLYVETQQCGATKKGDGLRCTNSALLFNEHHGWLCGTHGKGIVESPGRLVLSPSDFAMCSGIRDSVNNHKRAKALLSGRGRNELSLVWKDPETGVLIKARLDRLSPLIAGGVIGDVKSTGDASEAAFMRTVVKYGYHRQAGLYTDGSHENGLEVEHFAFIACEKVRPYPVAVYRLMDAAVDAGRADVRPLIRRFADCLQKDQWPAYSDDIVDLTIPDWYWSQIAETEDMGA